MDDVNSSEIRTTRACTLFEVVRTELSSIRNNLQLLCLLQITLAMISPNGGSGQSFHSAPALKPLFAEYVSKSLILACKNGFGSSRSISAKVWFTSR